MVEVQTTHIYRVKSVWWRAFLHLGEDDLVWIQCSRKSSLGGYISGKVFSTYNISDKHKSPYREIGDNIPMEHFEAVYEW